MEQLRILILFHHSFGRNKAGGGVQVQLTNLLLQRELGHKTVDVTVHFGIMINRRLAGAGRSQHRQS